MKHYKKHIDNFFQEKLGNYRETPPPDAWEDLETRLDGLKPGAQGTPYRLLIHVAIVSVLLLLTVSLIRKITGNTPGEPAIAGNVTTSGKGASTTSSAATVNGENPTASATNTNTNGTTTASQSNATTTNPATGGLQVSNTTANTNTNHNSKNPAAGSRTTGNNKPWGNTTYAPNSNAGNTVTSSHNSYSKTQPNPAPEEETNDNNQVQAASPNTTLSVVKNAAQQANTNPSKKPATKPSSTSTANNRTRTSPTFPKFEAGVKAGYEGGFSNGADNKLVVSPYLQYNLSSRFSVMTQPGVKFASLPNKSIGSPATYYNANPESAVLTQTTTVSPPVTIGGTTVIYYTTQYHYTQPHDSIIKSNKIGGTSMQYELPILLKYKLTKQLSVYGGVNFVFNKLTSITENTYTAHITRTQDTTVTTTAPGASQPNFGFTYTGNPISQYTSLAADKTGYQFSTGFMVGFSYAYSKKWLIDALVEQNPASPDVKAGYNINTPLSATYFRLSIGYNLTK